MSNSDEILDEMDYFSLKVLYDSMKDSIIDVAAMDSSGVKEMKKFVYDHGKTGDLLRVNVSINENTFLTEATFVEHGTELESLDTNIFLPFDGLVTNEESCTEVTISSSTFRYKDDTITLNDEEITFGTPFMMAGRRVVLAKGSVVIILEDTLAKVFPEDGVQEEIINNDGTLALGDVTTVGISQLERKEDSGNTSVISYVFLHDETTDERTCVSKRTHTVDFFDTATTSQIDLGYVDSSDIKTIENVVNYNSSDVNIRSISSTGEESIATIGVDGLSFSSDDSSIIFPGGWVIKFDEPTDTIQIQYYDTLSSTYVTKREFGR